MAEDAKKTGLSVIKIGQTRIIAGLIVLAVVGGMFASVMLRTGGAQKSLLYSGLDLAEASEIAGRLDQANIKYDMRGDGSSIFVDRKAVLDARIMLSAEGLPTRGSVGYEVFDKQDALGATTFIQNVNRLRALEGELARTINSLENVKSARVHLVLPERRLFERDEKKPSASIVIDIVGRKLDNAQIRAIRNLAAGAVPGLDPDQVTILDTTGRLLAAASDTGSGISGGMSSDERRAQIEEELRRKVLAQLEPVVGEGAARVQISADVDFNRVTRSSEIYDPDGRVVRGTRTVEESNSERIRGRQEAVTVEQNLPDNDDAGENGPTEDVNGSRLEETVNYEISKTTQTEIIEGGTVQRLSIAVAIDHMVQTAAAGGPVEYTARTLEEMRQLTALVRSAVGYDEARGDVVEVVNLRFAQPVLELGSPAPDGILGFNKSDLIRAVEIIALLLGGLALILFVLRPLVAGLLAGPSAAKDGANLLGNENRPQLTSNVPKLESTASKSNSNLETTIDVANVTGQVKASSMRKIAELIETQPDESVAILRTWLNDSERSMG